MCHVVCHVSYYGLAKLGEPDVPITKAGCELCGAEREPMACQRRVVVLLRLEPITISLKEFEEQLHDDVLQHLHDLQLVVQAVPVHLSTHQQQKLLKVLLHSTHSSSACVVWCVHVHVCVWCVVCACAVVHVVPG